MTNQKKVSLLLMTRNCREHVYRTLKSIEEQDYGNIEVCVQDSCSDDGTFDIIIDYAGKSKHKYVYKSEKDKGLYDGLNRAIEMSSGAYLLVMNDEFVCRDAVSKLVTALEQNPECVGAHSDLVYAGENTGKLVRYWKMGQGTIEQGWCPAHPTMMVKREIYDIYGLYDLQYVSASDYEFMVRFLKEGKNRLAYVPEVLVSMYAGGTSNQGVYNYYRSVKESIKGLKKNKVKHPLLITLRRTIKVSLQFLKGK